MFKIKLIISAFSCPPLLNWAFTSVSSFYSLLIVAKPLSKITCLRVILTFCHLPCYMHLSVTSPIPPEATHFLHPYFCPCRGGHHHSSTQSFSIFLTCLPVAICSFALCRPLPPQDLPETQLSCHLFAGFLLFLR